MRVATKKLPKIILLANESDLIDRAIISLLWSSSGNSGRYLNQFVRIRRKLTTPIAAASFTYKQFENILAALSIFKQTETPTYKRLRDFYERNKES